MLIALSRSSGIVFTVNAIIGMFALIRFGRLRIFAVDSYQSITAISMSIRIKS